MTKPKQLGLGTEVPMDEVGIAAKNYLKKRDEASDAKEAAEAAAANLVDAMKRKRRKEIRVEGMTISVSRIEAQDKLKVKKPKE